jgi:hypothetical protein
MSLGVNGGLSNGGVGTCRIGKGGALVVRASVTPGIVGMRGGKERHSPRATRDAIEAIEYFIVRKNEKFCVGLMSTFAGYLYSLYSQVRLYFNINPSMCDLALLLNFLDRINTKHARKAYLEP